MRRDLLQLGVDQDPAPDIFPQPLPVRASCGVDRAHRRRSAFVPLVLSASARAAPRADRHRARFQARAALRRFPERSRAPAWGVPPPVPAAVPPRGQSPDPGAVEPVLPQSDGVRHRPHRQRLPDAPIRGCDQARPRRQALRRRAAARARPDRAAVLRKPRLFPRRHGSSVGVRQLPAPDRTRAQRRRAVHDGRPAETGQDAVLSRLPAPSEAFDRQLHHRAWNQGAGDGRVHAAVLPVRVQGHPRQDRGVEGNDAREGQGKIRAGQAPRSRRKNGGHARILGCRISARTLHARNSSPS